MSFNVTISDGQANVSDFTVTAFIRLDIIDEDGIQDIVSQVANLEYHLKEKYGNK